VLPLDVNHSDEVYRVEKVDEDAALNGWSESSWGEPRQGGSDPDLPDGRPYGIRLSLAEVKGASAAEVARMVANRPYHSLADFWHRARVSRPVVERLVIAGAFDSLYGLTEALPVPARGQITRRDLLLQLADLERWTRSTESGAAAKRGRARRDRVPRDRVQRDRVPGPVTAGGGRAGGEGDERDVSGVRRAAARQSQAALDIVPAEEQPVQLALDLGDAPDQIVLSGLPEMTGAERVRAELEVLGLDASRHVLDFYAPMLTALAVTRARDVLNQRNRAELLVAGVKVATQTPPIRTGRRVVFLTLDDSTGPIDATFFEDAQAPYARTVFHSWLLVVRGVLRRTGEKGVSLRATGAWELPMLWDIWTESGLAGVQAVLQAEGDPQEQPGRRRPAVTGLPAAAYHGGVVAPADSGAGAPGRVIGTNRDDGALPGSADQDPEAATGLPTGDRASAAGNRASAVGDRASASANRAPAAGERTSARSGGMGGGPGRRRVLVHPVTGYRQSPYADLETPGGDTKETRRMLAAEEAAGQEERRRREPPRKLWHASPGSSGR
jgi:error-prone DNA polymerase